MIDHSVLEWMSFILCCPWNIWSCGLFYSFFFPRVTISTLYIPIQFLCRFSSTISFFISKSNNSLMKREDVYSLWWVTANRFIIHPKANISLTEYCAARKPCTQTNKHCIFFLSFSIVGLVFFSS